VHFLLGKMDVAVADVVDVAVATVMETLVWRRGMGGGDAKSS
jgi:hypothetical protein